MKTRVGKIARLDYETREQLNLRLLNGELGAPLLKWLNELPDTVQTVAELFGGKPITKQNLSEWRHGGYEDWLRHWKRQDGFRQMNEQGGELKIDEDSHHSFENFSRLVLAEMSEDLNELHEITNRTERWKRLREISRDLARLQHSYNHSRKVELSFQKWHYETGDNDQDTLSEEEAPAASESPSDSEATAVAAPPACPSENHEQAVSATTPPLAPVAPSPTESQQKNSPAYNPIRAIHHRRCRRDCICKDCHPDDGEYPYAQAVKDYEETWKPGYWGSENFRPFLIMNVQCDCYCDCMTNNVEDLGPPPSRRQVANEAKKLAGGTPAVPGSWNSPLQMPPTMTASFDNCNHPGYI